MIQRSLFPRIALLAALALVSFQANDAMAQGSGSSFPSTTFTPPSFTPPVVVKQPDPRQVGIPARNMPDRLPEMRIPVNPVAAQANLALPRRAVLNRLENRLTTEPSAALGNTVAKSPNSAQPARQLLESAQPIL